MNKIETGMNTWNRPTAGSGEGREDWMKEGEGINQRTYMHDLSTRKTV